jgi:hypothetical protein
MLICLITQAIRAWNIAIEAPSQVFLTITLISWKKITASPLAYNSAHSTINLSWMPIVTITYSVLTILISFLKTTSKVLIELDWSLRVVISLPIFIFRMLVWQVLAILLGDISFVVAGLVVIFNCAVLLTAQKDGIILDPFSHAVQALVFPTANLFQIKSEKYGKTFALFTFGGNCILMFGIAVLFVVYSVGLYDSWILKSVLISKAWFETIFWATVPLFFAATLPVFIQLCFPR